MSKSPNDVKKLAKDAKIEIIDLRFVDLPGVWQHFSLPARELSDDMFTRRARVRRVEHPGLPADPGERHAADRRTPRRPSSTRSLQVPTLSMICNVLDPVTREALHPRSPAHRAEGRGVPEEHAASPTSATGARRPSSTSSTTSATTRRPRRATTTSTRSRASGTRGAQEGPNLGYKLRHKEGYFPCPPADQFQDLRSEMILTLEEVGVPVEVHHHEVGTAGQAEIDMRFGPLTKMADSLMYYKYIIRNVAASTARVVTFMPKPIFGDNGSGMHCHQSLWKGETNLFWDEKGYGQISETARHYIGGLLKHAPALLAICAPTTNSYRRLVPGLRGSGQPGLLPAQPLGGRADPDLLPEPEVEADRVPLPRPVDQPLPRLRRHAHGRARRRPEQDRPGRARSTRTSTTSSREEAEKVKSTPGSLGRGARTPSRTTTPACSRATCSPRT